MSARPRFLLAGFGSELSLRPLERALRSRGFDVALLDLGTSTPATAELPEGSGPLVLITSQHTLMTGPVYDEHYQATSHYVSPQALGQRLRADLLVYVPHDLLEPVLPAEMALLGVFDLYAAPTDNAWWVRAHVPVVVTGWVGTAALDLAEPLPAEIDRGVLFVSGLNWLRQSGGGEFLLRSLERTLEHGVAAKLPDGPGYDEITATLERAGVPLIEPRTATSAIAARTPLVVTNVPGSVLAEAALAGHRPMCLTDHLQDPAFVGQLSALDVIVCSDAELPRRVLESGRVRPAAPPFDLESLITAIDEQLVAKFRA